MAKKERKPGWWYPWIFVGCMALVVVVNGIMISFAVGTWTGLETKDHYIKGIKYNDALAATKAQEERGWVMEHSFAPDAERKGELRISFRDRDGKPLDDLDIQAMIIRPTHEGFDSEVAMAAAGDGVYAGQAAVALPGQWTLRVHARQGDFVFQDTRRFEVP